MTFEERAEFLFQSIESHDRQIGEITSRMGQLQDSIEKLVAVTNEDATAICTLARIADAHERRIFQIEERG